MSDIRAREQNRPGRNVVVSNPVGRDGAPRDDPFLAEGSQQFPQAFSPDGDVLVFEDRSNGVNIGMLALDGDRSSTLLLQGEFAERNASLSSDGKWIAYESDESGVPEIYVRPFPDVDAGRWQVSSGSGRWPVWNPAGQELFFRTTRHVMALAYENDPTFRPGALTQLFEVTPYGLGDNRRMAVGPDGERFLLLKEVGETNTEDATPLQNQCGPESVPGTHRARARALTGMAEAISHAGVLLTADSAESGVSEAHRHRR